MFNINFNWLNLDILNRIGIILNFLAGFLLAPDLIGKERILYYEKILETKFSAFRRKVNRFSKKLSLVIYSMTIDIFSQEFDKLYRYIQNTSLFIYNFFQLFLFIPSLIITSYLFYQIEKIVILFFNKQNILYIILMIINMFISIILAVIISYFIFKFLYQVLIFFIFILNKIENKIKKDNTFLDLMTFWGIIFFIFGNLLQFIASFK
ncbi:hypothetical protein ACWATR_36805 [Nostoc sp. UIC 10890]